MWRELGKQPIPKFAEISSVILKTAFLANLLCEASQVRKIRKHFSLKHYRVLRYEFDWF